jgi:hypothetical protein
MSDMPADFWNNLIAEGVTLGDMVRLQAEMVMAQILAVAAYCKEHGLALSREDNSRIDRAITEIIRSPKYGNSRSRFNSAILKYHIDADIYREILRLEALLGVFNTHVFDAETGTRPVTAEMVDQIYQAVCAQFKHLMLLNVPGTRDVDGNPIQFTEEEHAQRRAKIEDWYGRIKDGEDIEDFYGESDDDTIAHLPYGYTISSDTGFVSELFVDALFEMEIGEVRIIESDLGLHIIKRYELVPAFQALDLNESQQRGASVSWAETIDRMIRRTIMNREIEPFIEALEINREETDLFTVASSVVMFDNMYLGVF